MSETIHYVTVELVHPNNAYPEGLLEEGYYIVRGDTVHLVTRDGKQRHTRKGAAIKERVPLGATARSVAWRLTKQNMPNRNSGFTRRIQYFNPGKI